MDYKPLRGLDAHITNPCYREFTTVETCGCGCKWEARCYAEYGRSYFVDEDGLCPDCRMPVED